MMEMMETIDTIGIIETIETIETIKVHIPPPKSNLPKSLPLQKEIQHISSYTWDCLPDYIDSDSITNNMLEYINQTPADIDWNTFEKQLGGINRFVGYIGCRYLLHRRYIPYKNYKITRDYISVYYGRNRYDHKIVTYIYSMESSPYTYDIDINDPEYNELDTKETVTNEPGNDKPGNDKPENNVPSNEDNNIYNQSNLYTNYNIQRCLYL